MPFEPPPHSAVVPNLACLPNAAPANKQPAAVKQESRDPSIAPSIPSELKAPPTADQHVVGEELDARAAAQAPVQHQPTDNICAVQQPHKAEDRPMSRCVVGEEQDPKSAATATSAAATAAAAEHCCEEGPTHVEEQSVDYTVGSPSGGKVDMNVGMTDAKPKSRVHHPQAVEEQNGKLGDKTRAGHGHTGQMNPTSALQLRLSMQSLLYTPIA